MSRDISRCRFLTFHCNILTFRLFSFPSCDCKMCKLMFWWRGRTGWLYNDNPNCTDTAITYVTGDLTGTLCSLTKAFLFKTIGGKLPENHSQRVNVCPSGDQEINKEQRVSDCFIIQMRMEMIEFPRVFKHLQTSSALLHF